MKEFEAKALENAKEVKDGTKRRGKRIMTVLQDVGQTAL